MADEKRVRLAPEERREQLIQIGVRMLAGARIEDLSVEAIAREAGISRGLLFHYFESKQDFQLAIAERVAEDLYAAISLPSEGSVDAQLRSALGRYVDHVSLGPELYVSMVRGAMAGDGQMRALGDRTRRRIVDVLLERCRELGLQPAAYGEIGAYAWIALNEELVTQWLRDPAVSRDELIDLMIAPLPGLIGIAPIPATP